MNKKLKKYVYTPIVFVILGICILSLPYYYQYKAYLSYANPGLEFAYRNSAIATSILPSTKAEMIRDRAMWFYVNGKHENCIKDLLKIEQMKQAIADDFALLANCYMTKKNWTMALEYAQKSGRPNEIAKVYLGMNELDVALKFSNSAVDDDTNKQYSKYLTRAKIQMQMGRYYEALMDLNKLVSYIPDEAWPYYERAKLKRALKDYEGANADLQKARELDKKIQKAEEYFKNTMLAEKM